MKQNGKTNNSFLLQLGSIPAGHSTPTNVRWGNSNLENVLRTRLAFRSSDVSSFHFQWTNFLKMLKWGEGLRPWLLVWSCVKWSIVSLLLYSFLGILCFYRIELSPGGLNLSRHRKKVSLDSFKKLVSTIEKSRFCLDTSEKVRKVSIETKKSAETWHFWQILTVYLDRELVNVITFLDRDFSICQDFWAWSLEKVLKKSRLCREISKILNKSWKSRFVSTISICLDDLDLSRRSR